ncbi:VanZ family protein [Spirosoma panaciterrae]|uniref:VanZ family protein n=1 Tax=Spirosoma panaciterrae TaxID=496058 RepID=UPI00036BB1FB|nr:VanZ family protein [Spirosoma panaciterrae]
MTLDKHQSLYKKLAIVYTVLILLLVTLPINGEDQFLGKLNDNYVLQIRYDYISHAVLFIPWIILVWWGWAIATTPKSKQLAVGVGGLSFAIFCEYLQLPLTYRTFNINDLLANSLGIGLGLLFLWLWEKAGMNTQKG